MKNMAKRTEGAYEKAYKELKFYVRHNICKECQVGIESEISIIEKKLSDTTDNEKIISTVI